MNGKALLIVLALSAVLLATPFIATANAGKGVTKQYYEFYLEGVSGATAETKYWVTEDNIMQIRNYGFTASYIEVTVGGTTYHPNPALYSCSMDFTLDLNTMTLYARVHETFTVAGGIISQQTAETVYDYGTEFNGGGNFVGFGSDSLSGVKIQGTTGMAVLGPGEVALDRVGTVMGWP